MFVWPPSQKKCPACEAKLRFETRNEMSFKGSLIYLLLVVAIFSFMALRWISLSHEKSLDWIFWILVPVILFIIAPIVALYQINADVIYLKESEKPENPPLCK
jgi:branched-subunit amino acid permease